MPRRKIYVKIKTKKLNGNHIALRKTVGKAMVNNMKSNCDSCMNYYYDDEYECYTCAVNLDEDEMYRFMSGHNGECPYFRMGDDYTIVRKQN